MRDRDRVTISLYSIETNEDPGYNKGSLGEISNIKKIHDGLIKAAELAGHQPPLFVVSILLIPNWPDPEKKDSPKDNSYENPRYLQRKGLFIDETKKRLKVIPDIEVEDFYMECASKEEREYMHNLKALGSNADMIKTRAIINNSDQRQHLQIDSNTVVPSFKELYDTTFNARVQKDGINASYYDEIYISAHNKMVYTTPTGLIAKSKLGSHFKKWCEDHCNDDQDKQANKNSIYARVFTQALSEIKYVKEYTVVAPVKKNKEDAGDSVALVRKVYAATLDDKVYWLTSYMVTALNKSWSTDVEVIPERLKKLPAIEIGEDGLFNYQCLLNVIKKHTGNLRVHSKAIGLDDSSGTGDASRNLLLSLSNCDLEIEGARKFILNAIKEEPLITVDLLELFQDTKIDNRLTDRLFDCTVKDLPTRLGTLSNVVETELDNDDEKVTAPRP